jgi:hypothetical protein
LVFIVIRARFVRYEKQLTSSRSPGTS